LILRQSSTLNQSSKFNPASKPYAFQAFCPHGLKAHHALIPTNTHYSALFAA
jgi:hypothetical protein